MRGQSLEATPRVALGAVEDDGIAASFYSLLERGVDKRPRLARKMRGRVEFRFHEGYAPVRISFDDGQVLIEDGPCPEPSLQVGGRLPHLVALTTVPLVAGMPSPAVRRGRLALARIADGRLAISGDWTLARQLLRLLAVERDVRASRRERLQASSAGGASLASRRASATSSRTPKPEPPFAA